MRDEAHYPLLLEKRSTIWKRDKSCRWQTRLPSLSAHASCNKANRWWPAWTRKKLLSWLRASD